MTVAAVSPSIGRPAVDADGPQRFVFRGPNVDWAFYQGVRQRAGRRSFVTY